MPLNQLKKYPELLDLAFLSPLARKASLRGVFDRDVADNPNFKFRSKTIYPLKTDGIVDMERTFAHLTTELIAEEEDGKIVGHRVYERFRSERLHWLLPHVLEKINDTEEIHVFNLEERDQKKRQNTRRTYIYNQLQKYVVVLEPQHRDGYYLLTAYHLNRPYAEKQMKKKMRHAQML